MKILELQQLRGILEHFPTAAEVWLLVKNPKGKLLRNPDEQGMYVRFPSP